MPLTCFISTPSSNKFLAFTPKYFFNSSASDVEITIGSLTLHLVAKETTKALLNSRKLLEATWKQDEEAVARYIEEAHLNTSILTYNNENALAYTLLLAYISARDYYTIIREMPTGKGFADIVFIPRHDNPAMIIELKWNQDVETALTQIKEKKYPRGLEKYKDNLLIVGISYDKKTKKHTCFIEKEHS